MADAIPGVAIMTIKESILVTAMFDAGAASSAVLPLKPGSDALLGVSCKDFAFTALSSYDGRKFSYPHASRCRSVIRSHVGTRYHLRKTCLALGDGTPTAPTVMEATDAMQSSSNVMILKAQILPFLPIDGVFAMAAEKPVIGGRESWSGPPLEPRHTRILISLITRCTFPTIVSA